MSSLRLESSGAPDMSGGTPDSPVRQTRGAFGCPFALLILVLQEVSADGGGLSVGKMDGGIAVENVEPHGEAFHDAS